MGVRWWRSSTPYLSLSCVERTHRTYWRTSNLNRIIIVLVADYRRALGVVDVLIPTDLSNGGIVYDCVASVVEHVGLVRKYGSLA